MQEFSIGINIFNILKPMRRCYIHRVIRPQLTMIHANLNFTVFFRPLPGGSCRI